MSDIVDVKPTSGQISFLPDPEPRRMFVPIISADDHVLEPADAFTSRVPARLVNGVPYMKPVNGIPHWIIDGQPIAVTMVNAVAGRPQSEWHSHEPISTDHVRPGAWQADARVADMDVDGVWASLNFPSLTWGFSGRVLSALKDPEAGQASVRAYNDWYFEEWLSRHPERFIGGQIVWLHDPQVAAQEIYRNAERGFRAVSFTENPEGLGLPDLYSYYWDPFFAACEDTNTSVNIHVGSSGSIVRPSTRSPMDVLVALFPLSSAMAVVDWIYALIPVRFPRLKIILSEGGVSWVPAIAERLRRAYRQCDVPAAAWDRSYGDPVEIMRRNFYFTSIEDPSAFHLLDLIGEDNIMVEVDYPHQDSSWPDTQELLRTEVHHLDRDTIEKVAWRNAATVFQHPAPSSLWVSQRPAA